MTPPQDRQTVKGEWERLIGKTIIAPHGSKRRREKELQAFVAAQLKAEAQK